MLEMHNALQSKNRAESVVNTTEITVRIRLRLKSSDWTTSTGRRYPGSEATGSGNSAHQTSPRRTTSHLPAANAPAGG